MNKINREFERLRYQLRGIIYLPLIYWLRTIKKNLDYRLNNKEIEKNIISILCPSRGRPANIIRLIKSLNEKSRITERVELLIYVDNDDNDLDEYKRFIDNYKKFNASGIRVILNIGEPKSISISWNDLANISTGDVLMMGNDDCVLETYNWDIILDEEISKFPDKLYCIWFDDGTRSYMYADFPIISRKWFKILGYFTPGCFEFTFNDTWIRDLGSRINRLHFVKKVKQPHLHANKKDNIANNSLAKSRVDELSNRYKRDEKKYYELSHLRIKDSLKLKKFKNKLII